VARPDFPRVDSFFSRSRFIGKSALSKYVVNRLFVAQLSGVCHTSFGMIRVFALICCITLAIGAFASANPENVMVEGYTFTRPAKWKWQAPVDTTTLNRFTIPPTTGDVSADVRFYYMKPGEELRQRVIANFQKGSDIQEKSVRIRDHTVTYIIVTGTTVGKAAEKSRSDFRLIATTLIGKESQKAFLSRLYGPRTETDAAQRDFEEMIERAIRDAE
jgi:hypothetical protein